MTVSLKHKFTSSVPDDADTGIVRPSNWNDEHDLTLGTGKLLGRTSSGTGAAEEISVSGELSLTAGALSTSANLVTLTGSQTLTNKTLTSPVITGGTTVTVPSSADDLANKAYVDSVAQGLNFHASCRYATTAALPTYTYNNGASGVGATITAVANGALSVDSATPSAGDRILVKNETLTNAPYNGVYTVTTVGSVSAAFVLTRATDYDTSGSGTNEIDEGDFILVIGGTVNANSSWVQQTPLPITVGTTSLVFIQFGGAGTTYTAGTGLTLVGTQFSLTNPVATNLGGTGLSTFTAANNALYSTSSSALTAGTLPVAAGGTGQTTASSAFNALSPITTTGDIILGNGSNSATRLPIGTNGYVLTSNGTTASWQASTGGVSSFQTSLNGLSPSTSTTGAITLSGTLGASSGGTGQTTYTTGDVLYASGSTALSKLGIGSTGQVLTVSGGVPTWATSSAGGATGGGTDKIFWNNDQTVTTSYSIPSNTNAGTFGPITIGSSATITIPSSSSWTVV